MPASGGGRRSTSATSSACSDPPGPSSSVPRPAPALRKDLSVPVPRCNPAVAPAFAAYAVAGTVLVWLFHADNIPRLLRMYDEQHEIDLRYTDALTMADNVMTFRLVVKEVAASQGVHATFMPKPLEGVQGSGMHLHMSLFRDDQNAFFDEDDPYAGQPRPVREVGAFLRASSLADLTQRPRLVDSAPRPMIVTAAASVPSSFTLTNVFCLTNEIESWSPRGERRRKFAHPEQKAFAIPIALRSLFSVSSHCMRNFGRYTSVSM